MQTLGMETPGEDLDVEVHAAMEQISAWIATAVKSLNSCPMNPQHSVPMTIHPKKIIHHANADVYSNYALYDQALHVHRVNHTSDTLHHTIHVRGWVTLKDFPNQV